MIKGPDLNLLDREITEKINCLAQELSAVINASVYIFSEISNDLLDRFAVDAHLFKGLVKSVVLFHQVG